MRKADTIWISKLLAQVAFAAAIFFIVHLISRSYGDRLEALKRQNKLYEIIITSPDAHATEKSVVPSIKMIQDNLNSSPQPYFSLNTYLLILVGVTIIGVSVIYTLNEKLRKVER